MNDFNTTPPVSSSRHVEERATSDTLRAEVAGLDEGAKVSAADNRKQIEEELRLILTLLDWGSLDELTGEQA